MKRSPALCAFVIALAACSSSTPSGRPSNSAVAYPDPEWVSVTRPEDAGWSTTGLEKVREKLSTMSSTGMMAVVGGRVLFQYGDVQRVSYLASVRKSVLSMLYGIYQER